MFKNEYENVPESFAFVEQGFPNSFKYSIRKEKIDKNLISGKNLAIICSL